eukprot:m.108769 g.108769  ORF g.108769 m.108769 type:complete len:222 (+) comp13978_c0_seq1:142-807(+)
MMVDYSRFERMQFSDDSDEEVSEPGVYRVAEGESVTIPGRNVTVNSAKKKTTTTTKAKAIKAPPTDYTRNGAEEKDYMWSQTTDTLTVVVYVPENTKAKVVHVYFGPENTFGIDIEGKQVFNKTMWSEIEKPKEQDIDIDWEMLTLPTGTKRAVRVTIPKTSKFGSGVIFWWKAVFKDGKEIDTNSIKDRKPQKESFAEVFAKAQEQFKEKVKNIQPTLID